MRKFFFVFFAVAHAAYAGPTSPAAIEQGIIYSRAQDNIEQYYERMGKQREALNPPATMNVTKSPRPMTPATTPSDLSVDNNSASSGGRDPSVDSMESPTQNMGECNRRIFMQRRVIENQRRKILELQQQLNQKK